MYHHLSSHCTQEIAVTTVCTTICLHKVHRRLLSRLCVPPSVFTLYTGDCCHDYVYQCLSLHCTREVAVVTLSRLCVLCSICTEEIAVTTMCTTISLHSVLSGLLSSLCVPPYLFILYPADCCQVCVYHHISSFCTQRIAVKSMCTTISLHSVPSGLLSSLCVPPYLFILYPADCCQVYVYHHISSFCTQRIAVKSVCTTISLHSVPSGLLSSLCVPPYLFILYPADCCQVCVYHHISSFCTQRIAVKSVCTTISLHSVPSGLLSSLCVPPYLFILYPADCCQVYVYHHISSFCTQRIAVKSVCTTISLHSVPSGLLSSLCVSPYLFILYPADCCQICVYHHISSFCTQRIAVKSVCTTISLHSVPSGLLSSLCVPPSCTIIVTLYTRDCRHHQLSPHCAQEIAAITSCLHTVHKRLPPSPAVSTLCTRDCRHHQLSPHCTQEIAAITSCLHTVHKRLPPSPAVSTLYTRDCRHHQLSPHFAQEIAAITSYLHTVHKRLPPSPAISTLCTRDFRHHQLSPHCTQQTADSVVGITSYLQLYYQHHQLSETVHSDSQHHQLSRLCVPTAVFILYTADCSHHQLSSHCTQRIADRAVCIISCLHSVHGRLPSLLSSLCTQLIVTRALCITSYLHSVHS